MRSTPTDVALAAIVGALFALSPITSAQRLVPSLAGGCVFGLAFFGYRAALKRTSLPSRAALKIDLPLAGILILLAVLFTPTALDLYPWYAESIWRNAHSLFVPLLAFGLARLTLHDHAGEPARPSAWGFAPLALGSLLLVASVATHTLQFGIVGLISTIAGASLLMLGTAWTRHLLPAITLLLFMLPLPATLASPLGLPSATATGVEWALRAIDVPVLRTGVTVSLAENIYSVTVRCSGFSTAYGAAALALTLGFAGRSLPRTLIMLAAIWPLTWLANIVRTTTLVLVCETHGIALLDSPLHGISGIGAYLAVMGCTLLLGGKTARRRLLS